MFPCPDINLARGALLVLEQQDKIRNLCVTKIKLVWVKVKHTHVWKKCQLQHFEWNSVKSNKSAETSLGGFLPSITMTGITKFCPRIMSNFYVLDQQKSDSNSIELTLKLYFFQFPPKIWVFYFIEADFTYELS